ncbi:MAG: SRPBCC family protein [Devosia sp.]|nr:SRPBCC family protein [Devosia sp.]
MLWTILIAIVAIIAAFLIYVAMKPNAFRLERSIVINAPAERIFPLVDNFHNWRQWSPFEGLDPNLKRSYSGPESGVGAVYAYEGNNRAGAGRMEIRESVAGGKVLASLDFSRPFVAHNFAEFTFRPSAGSTVVNWAMYGPSPFMSKLFTTFMSLDSMIGKHFDEGLANLKRVSEG